MECQANLCNLTLYVNTNSSHHAMADYETYPYSSLQALVSTSPTMIKRNEVLELFDGVENLNASL